MERNRIEQRKGRPKGSISEKYRDDFGNPISVKEYRKIRSTLKNRNQESNNQEQRLLESLVIVTGKSKKQIISEAIQLYSEQLRGRLPK